MSVLKRLNGICETLDITLDQLADQIEIDPELFDLYESGEIKMDYDTAFRICLISGISPSWIQSGEGASDIQPPEVGGCA
jgi:transcriptional regulator with XRE-family HTH domain